MCSVDALPKSLCLLSIPVRISRKKQRCHFLFLFAASVPNLTSSTGVMLPGVYQHRQCPQTAVPGNTRQNSHQHHSSIAMPGKYECGCDEETVRFPSLFLLLSALRTCRRSNIITYRLICATRQPPAVSPCVPCVRGERLCVLLASVLVCVLLFVVSVSRGTRRQRGLSLVFLCCCIRPVLHLCSNRLLLRLICAT